MPFVSENKPGPLDDLISFEDDSRDGNNSLSEIQKLFDPLFQNRTPNAKNAVTMRTITNKCPYPPPLPAKPHVPWLLLHRGNHPLDAKCASISPAPHVNDENEDIASFLSIFISPTEKDALKCSVATTPYGFVENTSLSNAETDSIVSPTDSIRCTTECTPAVLRRRDEEKHRDCAFLPNTYTSVEIERFVETVESMNTDHVHTPTYSVQNETPSFDFDGSVGKHEKNINHYLGSFSHDNWVYNSVFGNVLAQDVLSHTSTCQNGSIPSETDRLEGQIPVRWWRTKTGASKVAEITPLAPRPSEVDGEAPMHWRNTPRWNIPQIEVRITGHWIIRRPRSGLTQSGGPEDCAQSAPDGTGSKSLSTDSQRTHSMPRLRLVSDPNSTFVCELMMEALSNIALPAGASMNANDYQLRIHGRAELLNPQARLCDCDQVQLCHRLDLPLRLILEPKRFGNSDTEQTEHATQTRGPFMPYSCSVNPLRVSPDGEMSISYGVFRNALDKVRATIIRNREKIEASKWLSEVQCARSTLAQSVKAVLAAVCQSVAFTDVLDALCHAQVCIMDAIQDAGLSGGTQSGKTLPTEHWLNSVRCKQTKLTDVTPLKYFTQPKPNTNTNQMASNTLVTEQTRKKLEHALRRLEANLLAQIHVFLDWRQIGLRVNPLTITCWPKAQDAVPIGRRPRGLLFESDSAEASAIKEMVLTSKCKETRSSADCVDPFVVGLIAVHRAPRFSSGTSGASSTSLPRSRSTSPAKMQSGSPSTDGNTTMKNNMDSRFYVRLSLTYAGHPLGRIWPQDLSSYSMETNSHSSLSRSSQSTRDTFYSDAGRTQTIISGFPKVLQFDQWFKFPGFSINCLPRETMLSVSLFSYKKGCPEQTEVDRTLVGWVNIPIFQANGLLKQNTIVAGLWSPNTGPTPEYRSTWTQSNRCSTCPLIQLVFPEYPFEIEYPKIDALRSSTKCSPSYRFSDLPSEAKQAVTEAECAVFLQTLDPELSANSDVLCWTSYSAAASASSRAARQGKTYPVLPDLHLSALTSCTSAGSSGFVTSPTGSVAPLVSAAATTGINDGSTSFATAPSPVAIEVLWNVRPWLTDMPSGLVALLIGVLITWPQEAQGDSFSRNAVWTWTRLLQDIYK
ncbi:hypothetical protein FGIG_09627 [Fasciola gigantica]|uniref:Uncharacterized protein n=1 Tax=Fasciola gigantica TaxID=46835 RepID=A0A504YPW3_FASGI|nr:hypothetical protein FGIG_09627 [Fasciola gigantica]